MIMMTNLGRIFGTKVMQTQRKTFLLLALLLTGGMASAQVIIKGNVYGGGNMGEVKHNTSVIVNGGTVGKKIPLEDRLVDKNVQINRVDFGNVYGGGNGYKIMGYNPNNNAPIFDINAGRVQGNTTVYIGGDAKVRRAVYGGGNMASVGVYTAVNGVATNYSEGATSVTIEGNALIGPKKEDLTTATAEEFAAFFGEDVTYDLQRYVDTAFKYLGGNEGWVFGSSRGISGGALRDYSFAKTTEVIVGGNAQVLNVFGSGENGHVQVSTNVTIKDNALIGGVPLHDGGTATYTVPSSGIATNVGEYKDATYKLAVKDSETEEDNYGVGREIVRGNVFGGGKGTDFISWFNYDKYCYTSGRVYGNTQVFVQDNARIYNRVYGGGTISMVGTFVEEESTDPDNHTVIRVEDGTGHAYVDINGGIIGSPGSNGHNCGEVYGGSRGLPGRPRKTNGGQIEVLTPLHQVVDEAYVGHTHVTVDGGTVMNNVYGGGANGHVQGNTYVTIKETDSNKRTTIGLEGVGGWHGNVYAGGGGTDRYTEDNAKKFSITAGRVFGNTNLNITGGTIMHNVYGGGALASVGPLPTTDYDPGTSTCTVNINGGTIGQVVTPTSGVPFNYGGNVYGAGRGIIHELAPLTQFASASNAVVNVNNGSGTVIGNVYGGGSYGQVKQETNVNMIGGSVEGSVFGGGMGIETEEIAGLVKGNATVDMRGGTVKRSVYGGGQMGSVGTYTYTTVTYPSNDPNGNAGKTVQFPTACAENTGLATVTMRGGSVGLNGSLMPWENHNPDDDDRGWIFCGGQGVADSITYPKAIALGVVNCTHLQISNTTSGENTIRPVVTASVYGGAENGLVLDSTFVEIAGGQIGTGLKSKSTVGGELVGTFDGIYTEQNWSTAITAINNGSIETALGTGSLAGVFHECDAWEYSNNQLYDIFADETGYNSQGGALVGTNGHSFFGNVFGGGSGYYPIKAGVWRRTAGQVNGNTRVEITGGHILTAVYGGNETTDVKGKSTIKMNGGTVGIPRTAVQIAANPLSGNIYGAGMGDPRSMFNAMTNVKKTQVYLTGGTVFGNVYGGSREGHVLDSTLVVIGQEQGKSTLIGTTGFSGFDGLVFGGGMGNVDYFDAEGREFPVGRVGGNTHVRMTDGKVLGSIYGGGLVALGGVNVEGWIDIDSHYDAVNHGRAKVEVSGGVIGNYANGGLDLLLSDQHVGNVFGGGRGSVEEYREDDLGRVGNAVVKISGSPTVYGSVYGGGQMANVGFWDDYDQWYHEGTAFTKVSISGTPTIGTQKEFDPDYSSGTGFLTPKWTFYDVINGVKMINHTLTGNVFGGGKGDVKLDEDGYVVGLEHGHCGSSEVSISGTPTIRSSVFGGSERGAVWGDAKVNITGGTIGTVVTGTDQQQSTYNFGSVFGGSYGADAYQHFDMNPSNQTLEYLQKVDSVNLLAGRVYGNTSVDITGGVVRGNVFGGGDMASVGEWNNNFVPKDNTGKATVTIGGSAVIGPFDWTGLNASVFGGGKGIGNDPDNLRKKYCNLNSTEVTVSLGENGRVFGSLFGGGSDAHTLGDTHVKLLSGTIGTEGVTSLDGNVFGGGRNFLLLTYAAGRVGGNTSVEMTDGNVLGSVYGGGRNGLTGFSVDVISTGSNTYQALPDNTNDNTYGRTSVKISGGTVGNLAHMKDSEFSIGDVYGGGKGSKTGIEDHHISSALLVSLVKETEVEISGTARIYGNVYGGGEVGNVGNYTWNQSGNSVNGIAIIPNTGHAKVTVNGGIIGLDNMQMITESGYPDDFGHVFGGGEGWVESPNSPTNPVIDSEGNHLVECMASVRTTEVTISDEAFVLGSVYGGSNNGHVLDSTWVKIQGGQIGAGENVVDANGHNRPYTDNEWNSSSLAECASWTYQEGGNPYDINILNPVTNKPEPGMNGATFYGHVFGGGSGFYPYGVDDDGNSQWLRSSGQVKGNTRVEVTDGHILTSLYGGCETTDVGTYTYDNNIHGEVHVSGGKSTVIISGGTIGVPRDSTSIVNHPVTCHVYGSGKGDPRFFFNTWTNVWDSKVEIKGTAWVYGSVFGGGEEGHVLNNVDLDVSENAKIGTLGYTNVDGNVFGGGRGFTGWALTAGTVGGNIDIDITGGTMLGSVYGGGRLASVGTYLVEKDIPDPENPSQTVINPLYGRFQPGDNHGFIDINISGGTIGNDHEIEKLTHAKPDTKGGNVYGGCMGKFVEKTGDDTPIWPSLARAKETNATITGTVLVKNSVYGGGEIGTLSNNATVNISGGTIGGNYGTGNFCGHVFGGGSGIDDPAISLNAENDSTLVAGYLAGRVYGNTTVNISGGQVYENVYGGGEVASVGWVKDDGTMVNGLAQVNMTGGIIGPLDDSGLNGFIFGGPKGGNDAAMKAYCNVNNTEVNVGYEDNNSNRVWGSLFGGGSDGHVLGNATVNVTNGTIGTTGITSLDGNVYGGGRNFHEVSETAGRVGGNTTVNILGGHMFGSVFGGGRLGSVGIDVNGDTIVGPAHGYTTVNVGGQFQIGDINFVQTGNIDIGHQITDPSHPDERVGGNVYGGAKGKAGAPGSLVTRVSKVKQTTVNIKEKDGFETWIEGSVFGSGEDGHVLQNTYVNIYDGQIGGHHYGDLEPCNDPYHGNVYGGGRGVDTYEQGGQQHYSVTAGWVQGNTNVNMYGGHVVRNVYGGGNLASVGVESNNATGLATVNIMGGTVGTNNEDENFGNVFGSGHGGSGDEYVHLAYVKNTHVTIGKTARVYGSVFGGGEDGHVRKNAIVDIEGGIIGDADDVANQPLDGNVYGGGRGLLLNGESQTAGEVYGYTTVNIKNSTYNEINYSPIIWNNVYGGGSQSVVQQYKVVNMSGGLVHGSVFGGSREIPEQRPNKAPRWVNMWGGTVEGNLHGCSYSSTDGDATAPTNWAGIVNLSGGTVKGNVYGAGYQGRVNESVALLIGENAINSVQLKNANGQDANTHKPETVEKANLDIKGSVFAGSYNSPNSTWREYDVEGYSNVYIDGLGYKTGSTGTGPEMHIRGGLFGSGTLCEAGKLGRNIVLRNYGERNMVSVDEIGDTLQSVSRTMSTIQRVGNLVFDNSNIALTGARDISNLDNMPNMYYGIYQVDTSFVVSNASSIVLGNETNPNNIIPANIDSVKVVRSVRLDESVYNKFFLRKLNYTWIGVKDMREDEGLNVNLYYNGENTALNRTTQENVIIFKGRSKLFVRYHILNENQYGELQGFFRMSSIFKPRGTESFAYARQKITPDRLANMDDGGFASYKPAYNFFTDNSTNDYTKTKQYPYTNVVYDMQQQLFDCRGWFIPEFNGNKYYVDGTGAWGQNLLASEGWGRYPDKPKLTIKGGDDPDTPGLSSIIGDNSLGEGNGFNSEEDVIYVVRAVSGVKELVNNNSLYPNADNPTKPLRLYRYPGGHEMSNGKTDHGGGEDGVIPSVGSTAGPGPNYGSLLVLDDEGTASNEIMTGKTLTLDNVSIEGFYGVGQNPDIMLEHEINPSIFSETESNVPMVKVMKGTLLLKGGTELAHGYNKLDASNLGTAEEPNYNFYLNPDFDNSVINGGGLYVDASVDGSGNAYANVKVEGKVIINTNRQKKGSGTIASNVYLPTFSKSIIISGELDDDTEIGITSPNRNTAENYKDNTFSPIAVAQTSTFAKNAWEQNSFTDDQNWFFVRDDWGDNSDQQRTTYYCADEVEGQVVNSKTLYFGWTWANVVRKQPATGDLSGTITNDFNYLSIDSPEDLAWLISVVNGENNLTASPLTNQQIKQTADFDLKQYVWVPIGRKAAALDLENHPFKGKYDGQGHTITNLSIEYLGKGDRHYKLDNYGLFGLVNNAEIKRTFVVSGLLKPESVPVNGSKDDEPIFNIGGLVGYLEGANAVVSNSEAAVEIVCPNYSFAHNVVAGGLVGQMANGLIHSSMAMPVMSVGAMTTGKVGGLVGNSSEGKVHNSFVNAEFGVLGSNDGQKIGGLLGANAGAKVRNCYVALHGTDLDENFDGLVNTVSGGSIDSCYVEEGYSYATNTTYYGSLVKSFTPASSADTYGYMYLDNTVLTSIGTKPVDTAMFRLLNHWVYNKHKKSHATDSIYAHWARPGLAYYEIKTTTGGGEKDGTMVLKTPFNDDLPVLLLSEFDKRDDAGIVKYQGGFRSVGTYAGGYALQYGGPDRDGNITVSEETTRPNELDAALEREQAGTEKDCLFIYGDVNTVGTGLSITQSKVSIHEDVSILDAGSLADFGNTYVGVTFDNSCGKATSTPGVNYGLNGLGMGGYPLPRDWHMFSTPLQEAPLGFEYYLNADYSSEDNNTNRNTYSSGYVGTYYNNIWTNPSTEFSWLNNGGSGDKRYWMKGWKNSQSQKPVEEGQVQETLNPDKWVDGYFPSQYRDRFGEGCIENTDEWGRYPYGMDFYTWTEPDYHWINFKRNGPNHWHTDTKEGDDHWHLDYKPYGVETTDYPANVNEEELIVGRGYMASIATETFMQSHGKLNKDITISDSEAYLSIPLTYTAASKLPGWNLVGNPYHGYLDFNEVGPANSGVLGTVNIDTENGPQDVPFYVIYDADKFDTESGKASTAFRYYPVTSSINGDYADRYLHPHQGFYVKKKNADNGIMKFTQGMIVTRSKLNETQDGHFRDLQPKYPLVNLYLSSDNGCADVTVIEFNRPQWGGAQKLKELRVGNGLFYGQHDGTHYAALFAEEGVERVPLWFEAKEDDIFTINWNTANGDFHSMYLIDNIAGVQYDMLRNDTYTFEGHKGDYPSRFYIVFDVTGVDEFDEGDQNFVFFDGSQWVVTGDGVLDFIDVHGRVLWSSSVSGQSRVGLPKVACGVYLMRLTNSNGTKVQKVIINKI